MFNDVMKKNKKRKGLVGNIVVARWGFNEVRDFLFVLLVDNINKV